MSATRISCAKPSTAPPASRRAPRPARRPAGLETRYREPPAAATAPDRPWFFTEAAASPPWPGSPSSSQRAHARVLLPTHPGFGRTPRADSLTAVTELARAYVALPEELDLTDVTVVGNSFGGRLAAEAALQGSRGVSGVVVIDGIGIEVDGHPMTDVRGMMQRQLRTHSSARHLVKTRLTLCPPNPNELAGVADHWPVRRPPRTTASSTRGSSSSRLRVAGSVPSLSANRAAMAPTAPDAPDAPDTPLM